MFLVSSLGNTSLIGSFIVSLEFSWTNFGSSFMMLGVDLGLSFKLVGSSSFFLTIPIGEVCAKDISFKTFLWYGVLGKLLSIFWTDSFCGFSSFTSVAFFILDRENKSLLYSITCSSTTNFFSSSMFFLGSSFISSLLIGDSGKIIDGVSSEYVIFFSETGVIVSTEVLIGISLFSSFCLSLSSFCNFLFFLEIIIAKTSSNITTIITPQNIIIFKTSKFL